MSRRSAIREDYCSQHHINCYESERQAWASLSSLALGAGTCTDLGLDQPPGVSLFV